MSDANADAPKQALHPCPICKQAGENVLLILENNVVQKHLTKIQQSSILSLPKTIDVLLITVDDYLCRTCGITYCKIKKEQKVTGAAQYVDQQGRPVDPTQLGAAR